MALQIRRGTAAQRTSVTPAEGELLYTTDTKLVYVGDGSTAGGNIISGGGGISDIVNDTSPQLGGALDTNGYAIVSANNADIDINPNGTGDVVLHGNLRINEAGNITKTGEINISSTTFTSFGNNSTLVDGNIYVSRNSYSGLFGNGFTFAQHHATPDAVNFSFYRTRGTGASPTAVQNNDDIADIAFFGWEGTSRISAASITAGVDGVPSTGKIPGKLQFFLHDGVGSGLLGIKLRAEMRADGEFKIDKLSALSGTSITLPTNNSVQIGDVSLSQSGLSTTNSNAILNIDANGSGHVIINGAFEVTPTGNVEKTGELNITSTTFTSFGNNSTLVDGNVYITRNSYSGTFGSGFTFAQHHATADAVNFAFYRTRGTALSPTSVLNGDDLGDVAFFGWEGTNRIAAATITAGVDGTPSTGKVPGKLQFFLHDGVGSGLAGIKLRAEIRADGTLRLDRLGALTSTNIVVPTNNTIDIGDIRLSQSGLSTVNSNANLFLTANANGRVYIDGSGWPASLGTAGQVLSTDGAGSLSWTNAPGYIARTTASGSTGNIADAATASVSITGFKTYSLLKIESTHAAWIRLYVSAAARTADASRAEGVDPAPGAGVIAEIVTTGSQTILMSPGVFGWNDESPVTTDIACAVTNKSGSTANISITCTLVQLEA